MLPEKGRLMFPLLGFGTCFPGVARSMLPCVGSLKTSGTSHTLPLRCCTAHCLSATIKPKLCEDRLKFNVCCPSTWHSAWPESMLFTDVHPTFSHLRVSLLTGVHASQSPLHCSDSHSPGWDIMWSHNHKHKITSFLSTEQRSVISDDGNLHTLISLKGLNCLLKMKPKTKHMTSPLFRNAKGLIIFATPGNTNRSFPFSPREWTRAR